MGECLVDETTEYGTLGRLAGAPATAPRMSAPSSLKSRDYRNTFQGSGPASTCTEGRREKGRGGQAGALPARPTCTRTSKHARPPQLPGGLWLGIAGQPEPCGQAGSCAMSTDVDLIGTSEDWGASKPDRAFF
ncbi:hypothetical protein LT493_27105 [Streptomyces tricolor]|nr:hypothetical protein [Streptomyces tricolor]